MYDLLRDPWVAAQVDAALAPYKGRLPDSEIDWMRGQLVETLTSDEHTARLLRRAQPVVVEESGEVRRGPPMTRTDSPKSSKKVG